MNLEAELRHADPLVADALDAALDGKDVTDGQAASLYESNANLVGMVADELRRKRVGDTVTYVVNRNINFTNVCIKQCGFCAFSRDFREEEGYFLPKEEVVRRAIQAKKLGATEICIQAGLVPDMDPHLYEDICIAIKKAIPDIHIHAFSPEEVLYGATRAQVTVREYLKRLKEAGVDTLPGTSAEILDQEIRDTISPGRISVKDWIDVIRTAHDVGIPTTSTMMFGHVETLESRIRHIRTIIEIQKETGGFTEFVPLNFVHTEAPMYRLNKHRGIRPGGTAHDVLLTHAISRIMINNHIANLQMSWVKEGLRMAQLLLLWGSNDFGGTLINESISTSAGAGHGQLLRPRNIRAAIFDIGRRPAERDTSYRILKRFDGNVEEKLDASDSDFGSYFDLIKIKQYRYRR